VVYVGSCTTIQPGLVSGPAKSMGAPVLRRVANLEQKAVVLTVSGEKSLGESGSDR
jgi:hypothetical protein